MLSKFHTVYEGGEAEIIEKKSRFIATDTSGHLRGRGAGIYRVYEEKILGMPLITAMLT